jgi:hypothetical protein
LSVSLAWHRVHAADHPVSHTFCASFKNSSASTDARSASPAARSVRVSKRRERSSMRGGSAWVFATLTARRSTCSASPKLQCTVCHRRNHGVHWDIGRAGSARAKPAVGIRDAHSKLAPMTVVAALLRSREPELERFNDLFRSSVRGWLRSSRQEGTNAPATSLPCGAPPSLSQLQPASSSALPVHRNRHYRVPALRIRTLERTSTSIETMCLAPPLFRAHSSPPQAGSYRPLST